MDASAIDAEQADVVTIARWRKYLLERKDVFLEVTLWYLASDGRHRWANFSIEFLRTEDPQVLIDSALAHQTSFVKSRWTRLEVLRPNRDACNNLVPGYIGDQGVLLATRTFQP